MLWTGIYISFEGNPVLWSTHSTFLHPRFFVCETGICRSLVSREPLKVIPSTLKHWRIRKHWHSVAMNCVHIISHLILCSCACYCFYSGMNFFDTVNFPSYKYMHLSFPSKYVICYHAWCSLHTLVFVSFYFCGFFFLKVKIFFSAW